MKKVRTLVDVCSLIGRVKTSTSHGIRMHANLARGRLQRPGSQYIICGLQGIQIRMDTASLAVDPHIFLHSHQCFLDATSNPSKVSAAIAKLPGFHTNRESIDGAQILHLMKCRRTQNMRQCTIISHRSRNSRPCIRQNRDQLQCQRCDWRRHWSVEQPRIDLKHWLLTKNASSITLHM